MTTMTMTSNQNQQTIIRKQMRYLRKQLTNKTRQKYAKQAAQHLLRLRHFLPKHAKIALYQDSFGELPTYPIVQFCQKLGYRPFLPIVRNNQLQFGAIYPKSLANSHMVFLRIAQKKHKLGMSEPICPTYSSIRHMDACICPLVAINQKGLRIGMGGGFYDRTLYGFTGLKIGWCYDFQLVHEIQCNVWDVGMDIIITPSQLIYVH